MVGQGLRGADGTGAGTAAAVGSAEGLVQVQVHHVEPQVAQFDASHKRVHIGAVAVDQSACLVHQAAHFHDVGVEKAQCAG